MTPARRLVACAAAAWLCAVPARASDGTFGITGGVTAATFAPANEGESIRLAPGMMAGFYGVIPLSKSVSVMTELLYVQKYSARTSPTRSKLRVEYVELPLLAKLPFLFGTYFTEGVAFAFPVEQTGLAPNLARMTSPDIAVVIGGGFNLQKYLAVELRYESSLRKVSNDPNAFAQRAKSYMAIAKLHF